MTTLARTAFDMGRYQKRSAAIARLDALMRAAPFSADEVTMLMKRYGPVWGVRQLRELIPLVDPGAASPKESLAATPIDRQRVSDSRDSDHRPRRRV